MVKLRARPQRRLCWDDPRWSEVLQEVLTTSYGTLSQDLADAISHKTIRVYHGCRVDDAGRFQKEGVRLNDPTRLEMEARAIVAEEEGLAWMRPTIEQRIVRFEARERDTGLLYVCLDDRAQLDRYGHYALYGSEWIAGLLGDGASEVLRRRGVPTMLRIDLPGALVRDCARVELADQWLHEWTRVANLSPNSVPILDFTICLDQAIAPEAIASHYHPAELPDPYHQRERVRSVTVCPSCAREA